MIFADTSFFIALLSPADEWHEAAVRHSRQAREPAECKSAMAQPQFRRIIPVP